ncbi:MAG: hypothetical protein FJY83_04975 [Candidatus Aminicenantes bacterium]|nr:hypothetical protein [Candidatus Aminicenantes bacterium]
MPEERLKKTLTLLIAAATFMGSVIVFLAVEAGGRAADAARDSRLRGIDYLTFTGQELWNLEADKNRLASFRELEAMRQVEEAYRLYRPAAESAANRLAEERFAGALESLAASGGVFSSRYFDRATGRFDFLRHFADRIIEPSARILEDEDRDRSRAAFWGRKANVYTTSLTVLAVAVFLMSLALAIPAAIRLLFAATGLVLLAGLSGFCLVTRAEPLKIHSPEDIERFSRISARAFVLQGYGIAGNLDRALEEAGALQAEADALVQASPLYTAARALRASIRQAGGEAIFYRDGPGKASEAEIAEARAEYERVLEARPEDGQTWWSVAYGKFLSGRHAEALDALRRAARHLPEQELGLRLNEAVYLLYLGRKEESAAALRSASRRAVERRRGSDPVYFRTVIRNLGRLREIRPAEGLDELEESAKEAFLAVSEFGRAEPETVATSVGPLTFVEPVYDREGKIVELNERDVYPPMTPNVSYMFEHRSLTPGFKTHQKVYWRPPRQVFWREQVHLAKEETWSGKVDGRTAWTVDFPLPGAGRGLPAGLYRVELYVQGNLISRGEFLVRQ